MNKICLNYLKLNLLLKLRSTRGIRRHCRVAVKYQHKSVKNLLLHILAMLLPLKHVVSANLFCVFDVAGGVSVGIMFFFFRNRATSRAAEQTQNSTINLLATTLLYK